MTCAERWQRDMGKGTWRTAAKEHPCDAFFTLKCQGTGIIPKGSRYFDTQEMNSTFFVQYRVCVTCADREHAAPEPKEGES